jgi:hypothetical protein
VPVIIWINGGFGAGKTTLAQELHRRLPDAVVYDPEDVGLMLWKWIRPNGDFQHLPSWRELVVATALSLRRHHAETLIVPMSLIRDAYRAEILGSLADAGEEILHGGCRCPPAGRDAHAALGQAHPGRASRRGAGRGRLASGARRRQGRYGSGNLLCSRAVKSAYQPVTSSRS